MWLDVLPVDLHVGDVLLLWAGGRVHLDEALGGGEAAPQLPYLPPWPPSLVTINVRK